PIRFNIGTRKSSPHITVAPHGLNDLSAMCLRQRCMVCCCQEIIQTFSTRCMHAKEVTCAGKYSRLIYNHPVFHTVAKILYTDRNVLTEPVLDIPVYPATFQF